MFKDKCILITGAAGTIGSALSKYVLNFHPLKLILLDSAETPLFYLEQDLKLRKQSEIEIHFVLGNILDQDLVENILKANSVHLIFHTAAYKHVPIIEKNPISGVKVNVLGTKVLADFALKYAVKNFVFISTDKAVKPSNVMGATKLVAEKYIKALSVSYPNKTKFITVRFGNIINSNGSVIPLFKDQIKKGEPITVTSKKATRYFISVSKVTLLLFESLSIAKSGDIFLFEMGEPISIYEIAETTIKELGYKIEDIKIKIIGLRPGEKLNEDLISENTSLLKTNNADIYRIEGEEEFSLKEIKDAIDNLSKFSRENKVLETVKELKTILPSFKSKNSKYENLD